MLRALLAVSLIIVQPDPWPPLVARAKEVVDRLVSGEVEPLLPLFTDKMKAAIDADGLRKLMPSLVMQFGAFKAQTGVKTESAGGLRIVLVSCAFERAEVEVRVAFDSFDRIGGIGFRPPAPAVAYAPPAYVTPAAFRDEAVIVDAGGWPLPGTLSMPVGDGPFPGVVLVHGSGPNDRDESLGPNKPFRDLAEGLASRGIAVLRYDKRTRTHGNRVAGLRDFTVKEEVIDDALAAVKKMRETRGVRADRVFVLGHSLGGMLAPRIAAGDPSIAGLIVMAGAARPLEQAIVDQTRYSRCSTARSRRTSRPRSMPRSSSPLMCVPSNRRTRRSCRRGSARRRRIGSTCVATILRPRRPASSCRCSCCRASATTRSRWTICKRGNARSALAPTCR